ncbi:MAG: PorT family protein [Bacteroidia bacterium]|nr:PorT family protein [Bacteroidia bacterium]
MKKRITLILIGFLAFAGLQAQNVGAGLSLGLNVAQIDGDGVGGYKKAGLLFGGYAFYDFTDNFSIQPEIRYSEKGSRETAFVPGIHYRFHYVEFPVFFNYNLYPGSPADDKLVFQAGPSIGYTISVVKGLRPVIANATHDFKRLDYGIHAGLTYYFNPLIGVSYTNSLSFFNINFQTQNVRRWPWIHRYMTFALKIGIK